jgi:hypothetical protein
MLGVFTSLAPRNSAGFESLILHSTRHSSTVERDPHKVGDSGSNPDVDMQHASEVLVVALLVSTQTDRVRLPTDAYKAR